MGGPHIKERDRLTNTAYYLVNREKTLQRQKKYYQNNKEKYAERARKYRNDPEKKAKAAMWYREYRIRKRAELIELLGSKCVRCGYSDIRALEIDHMKGGGNADKRMISPTSGDGADRMYIYYVKRPEMAKQTLQLLCRNCNRIKSYENHEQRYFGDVL